MNRPDVKYAMLVCMTCSHYRFVNAMGSAFQMHLQSRGGRQPRHEKTTLSQSHSSDTVDHRKVAIVPPSETNFGWYEDAVDHLNEISTRLGLPMIDSLDGNMQNTNEELSDYKNPTSYSHLLTAVPYPRVNSYALAIHSMPSESSLSKRKKKPRSLKIDPMYVDLCPPSNTRLGYRMNKDTSAGEELLLKALGLKKLLADKKDVVVYDLTAGLARDSLIILNEFVGNVETPQIRLHMMERDGIVALLVLDAMRRLQLLAKNETKEDTYAKQLLQCLTMEEGDSVEVLQNLSSHSNGDDSLPFPPDVCYLDPMFPPRKKKSAAVKKDMSMLHSLLGTAESIDDNLQAEKCRIEQEQRLLKMACKVATRRVVVKRPIGASPLGHLCSNDVNNTDDIVSPSYDIRGSVNRWDVYVLS